MLARRLHLAGAILKSHDGEDSNYFLESAVAVPEFSLRAFETVAVLLLQTSLAISIDHFLPPAN